MVIERRHLIICLISLSVFLGGFLRAFSDYQSYKSRVAGLDIPVVGFGYRHEEHGIIFGHTLLAGVILLGLFVRPRAYPVVIVKDPKVERLFDDC